jgi:uroporphyrinogen decarboxylase
MKKLSSEERIIRTLQGQDVDRVPTFEWTIDQNVIQALTPGLDSEEFCYEMGLDAICVDCDYESEGIEGGLIRDEWGMIKQDSGQSHTYPVDGPIRTMKDLENYVPPAPNKPDRYRSVEKALETHAGKKAVILHLNDVFSIPSRLMPFDHFMMLLVDEPETVKALVDISVDTNLAMAEEAVKRGIRIVYTGDDYAYNSGPIISPVQFRDLFYPGLKAVMGGYKDLGLLTIKHTDGNIMPLIDMIIDSDIDCLDPIDPIAGMDLKLIKKKYGDIITVKGNVDCAHTLTFKSVEETVEETKQCLEIGMEGGRYIASSSNSIHSEVKPGNYRAMIETIRDLGVYR